MSNEAREKAEFEYFDGQEENESNYRRFNDWRNGYDSRDAEVEALREQLREARSLAAGWAEIAVSSGTQETK